MTEVTIELKNVTKTFTVDRRKGLSRWFGHDDNENSNNYLKALDNVSFIISKGETIGILGLNGSGKTTLLRTIAGIYKPDSGSVHFHGRLAPLLQIGTGFQNELDANENIVMYGMLLGLTKSEIKSKIPNILEFAELERFRNMKLKDYSAGMRARLGFSTALQINPDILLVDEILAVGDAVFREKSFEAFLSFKKNQKTIVYATHNMKMISELSDRIILLHDGKIKKMGKPNDVIPIYNEIVTHHKSHS